jgi:hypothetical protein
MKSLHVRQVGGDTLEFLADTPNKMEENINPKEKDTTTKRNGTLKKKSVKLVDLTTNCSLRYEK